MYCVAFPSTKPASETCEKPGRKLPSALRGSMYPVAGLKSRRHEAERPRNVAASAASPVEAASREIAKSAIAYSSVVDAVPQIVPLRWSYGTNPSER